MKQWLATVKVSLQGNRLVLHRQSFWLALSNTA